MPDELQRVICDIENRTIMLPTSIYGEAAVNFVEAFFAIRSYEKTLPIELFVSGSGGEIGAVITMVNLIQNDGNVNGHLIGTGISGHSIVWASCNKRYVYPYSSLQVHAAYDSYAHNSITQPESIAIRDVLEEMNKLILKIYTSSSSKSEKWWKKKMYAQGTECYFIHADKLIEINMAEMFVGKATGHMTTYKPEDVEIVKQKIKKKKKD